MSTSAPVNIHPAALVEQGAVLGTGVQIGPFAIVEAGAVVHDGVRIHGQAQIGGRVTLGPQCEVYPQAVLGGAPQDTKYDGSPNRLVIGARTIIREHVTMHAGTAAHGGQTRIGADGYFMVASHVAHDCVVGDHATFSNVATLGGHVQIGDHVTLGGLSAVHQHVRIGHHAFIGGLAPVRRNVIPYGMVVGNPATLRGLNVIGMRRAGLARAEISRARAAYKALFCDSSGNFARRLDSVTSQFRDDALVMDMLAFIKARSKRALCLPHAH